MGHIQTEPAGRPSKPHKTAAELERTTCPAQKEDERSKDGVLQASLPSRSSCWDVSAVLQNSTGEQPVPLVGTSTHSGKPPSFQAHGDRGARSGSMGSGRPANVLRRSTDRGWGAGSIAPIFPQNIPSLPPHFSFCVLPTQEVQIILSSMGKKKK